MTRCCGGLWCRQKRVRGGHKLDVLMPQKLVVCFFTLFACICLPSCGVERNFAVDASASQPTMAGGADVRGYVSHGFRANKTETWMEWRLADGTLVADSRDVIKKADGFLRESGSSMTPQPVVVTDPRFAEPGWTLPLSAQGYAQVKFIVCLKPLIIVLGPGPIQDSPGGGFELDDATHQAKVLLPHGYGYGTLVTYSAHPVWFSPDLKQGLRPARQITDDVQEIPIPTGKLVLTREGNQWVVSCKAK